MTQSNRWSSYWAENVHVKRWNLFSLRLGFLFACLLTISMIFGVQIRIAYAVAWALGVSAFLLIAEYYRDHFTNPRYEWIKISVVWLLIAILVTMIWRHEANKQNNNAPLR